jgi:hypothetical protein
VNNSLASALTPPDHPLWLCPHCSHRLSLVTEMDRMFHLTHCADSNLMTLDDAVAALASDTRGRVAAETICKVIRNVIHGEDFEKYRRIKLTNTVVEERIVLVPGGVDILIGLGFNRSSSDTLVLDDLRKRKEALVEIMDILKALF